MKHYQEEFAAHRYATNGDLLARWDALERKISQLDRDGAEADRLLEQRRAILAIQALRWRNRVMIDTKETANV